MDNRRIARELVKLARALVSADSIRQYDDIEVSYGPKARKYTKHPDWDVVMKAAVKAISSQVAPRDKWDSIVVEDAQAPDSRIDTWHVFVVEPEGPTFVGSESE